MEWQEAYGKGQKAIDKGKCSEGVPLMLEAIKTRPKSDLRARPYGTFTIEYIPYFYLAKCAVESGDYESAQKYIKATEAGSIYSSSKASEFEEIKTKFLGMQKPKPPTNLPVETPPTKSIEQKKEEPPPPEKPEVSPPATEKPNLPKKDTSAEMVRKYMDEANQSFRSGDLVEARNAVNRALVLEPDSSEGRRLLADITRREQADSERKELENKLDSVRNFLRSGDVSAAENQILDLRSEYPGNSSVNSLYQEIQNRKQQQQSKLQQAELNRLLEKQILSAYYSGQYPAVIQLAEQSLKANPNSWRLNFYLGCAYTALSMLETQDRENRLQRARESFRRAKNISSDVNVPLISPKIMEVFRNS
jgi:tetratricopeptide (TPR) repeat protein